MCAVSGALPEVDNVPFAGSPGGRLKPLAGCTQIYRCIVRRNVEFKKSGMRIHNSPKIKTIYDFDRVAGVYVRVRLSRVCVVSEISLLSLPSYCKSSRGGGSL